MQPHHTELSMPPVWVQFPPGGPSHLLAALGGKGGQLARQVGGDFTVTFSLVYNHHLYISCARLHQRARTASLRWEDLLITCDSENLGFKACAANTATWALGGRVPQK